MRRSRRVTDCGAFGRENVGLSNRIAGESPAHRKSKVSLAMVFNQGLGDPKANPKGEADGQLVNIPTLACISKSRRSAVISADNWISRFCTKVNQGVDEDGLFRQLERARCLEKSF